MRGFTFLRRLFGGQVPCPEPDSPECRRKHEAAEREAEDAFKQQQQDYLNRMEDEIAVLMRERNGH